MGVYIHGMEMPKNCCGCVFSWYTPTGKTPFCKRTGKDLTADVYFNKRSSDCPLVPVPPHDGEAFEKVISERITQIEKWGKEPCNHPFEWMSILGEEFGELCEAVNETCFMNGTHPERGGDENIIREATQIAAVAIAIIRDFSPTIIPADPAEEDKKMLLPKAYVDKEAFSRRLSELIRALEPCPDKYDAAVLVKSVFDSFPYTTIPAEEAEE